MAAIGQYRHLVSLVQAGPPTPDPDGGWIDTWVPLDPPTWHCSIEAASLRDLQRISGGAISATATHLLRGRYHAQLSAKARVQFRDRMFEVQSVHDREQRQMELEVVCAEVTTTAPGPTRATTTTERTTEERPDAGLPAD